MAHRLILVGCGKMGHALLSGWLRSKMVDRVFVVEPGNRAVPDHPAVTRLHDPGALPADAAPTLIVFAVKPQVMDDVVPAYRAHARNGVGVLSIAAGKDLAFFADRLGPSVAVIRAMPNTPAAVGAGITVLVAAATVAADQRALAGALMGAVGAVEWVKDETLLDAVTALSGGGPAYVFLLMEAMAAAGVAAGLEPGLAMRLSRQTVIGAGALAAADPDIPASELRGNVTSPGGTTRAALDVLMADRGLQPLFDAAIAAAARRSRELAG
ncbi:MAG: pyrroline-5-carboxylate reductase [Inquilinaceae bacterium]